MHRRTILVALGAAVCITGGGAAAAGAAAVGGSPPASAAAGPKVRDIDADITANGRLRLEAETAASARRVSFTYAGRTVQARLTDAEDDDRTRDWAATVAPRQADRMGGNRTTVRVRACSDGGCTTITARPVVDPREDDDGDDD